ncbi:DUF5388 domain-containing protein [Apilactobacillus ozensis]|uniref:DUF5388 domain-containing protein n=1 Tax=Apilactobacillus ozensis TaxID=866801 RepID=UPI00200B3116|nr:DUF5388 domain-containing protein [Apilactobacillus ozensis]MCK8607242.1 DUF5388 domain-containing protein [Apilactobacillus ozensis]
MSSLVRSNRDIKPKNQASIEDFNKKQSTKEKQDINKNDKNVTSVTFNTNLKINNHIRNKLQAMALTGLAENQKDAIEIALAAYMESLTKNEREAVDLQANTLEARDVSKKNK